MHQVKLKIVIEKKFFFAVLGGFVSIFKQILIEILKNFTIFKAALNVSVQFIYAFAWPI